jgi:hypothetical protein
MRRGQTVRIHFAECLLSSLEIPEKALAGNFEAFKQLVESIERIKGDPSPDEKGNHKWDGIPWEDIAPFLEAYTADTHVCLANDQGRSLLYTYIESAQKSGDLTEWTVVVVGKLKGNIVIGGKPFRFVGRQRLMNLESPNQSLHPNRVTFQGVAMGSDESFDLTQPQIDVAKGHKDNYRSLAAAFRAQRPSSRGLLLLYPITPTVPPANDGSAPKSWDGSPVIGMAVSLPASKHDKGCDYVCTPQKLREIFGNLADDLKRDDEEDQSVAP